MDDKRTLSEAFLLVPQYFLSLSPKTKTCALAWRMLRPRTRIVYVLIAAVCYFYVTWHMAIHPQSPIGDNDAIHQRSHRSRSAIDNRVSKSLIE